MAMVHVLTDERPSEEGTGQPTATARPPDTERRRRSRIYCPFPATVSGADVNGEPFDVLTVIDNLSSNSLYLRIMPCVEKGYKLAVTLQLRTTLEETTPTKVALEGHVIRADQKPGGACGIAIGFEKPRFVWGP